MLVMIPSSGIDHFLDLTKLNPQTAKLDLIVYSSEKFNLTLRLILARSPVL